MINTSAKVEQLKCFFCEKTFLLTAITYQKKVKIINQQFFVFTCPHCQQSNYFWEVGQQYFCAPKIHLVLHQPEIVGNVGSVIRLAAAFNLKLHLIEPFGFIFSENWLRRSSANHLNLAKIQTYSDWEDFQKRNPQGTFVLTSAHGTTALDEFNFLTIDRPIYLVFGCESKGLPDYLKQKYAHHLLYIKQNKTVRSINLANAVSIFAFAAIYQYKSVDLVF